LLLPSFDRTPGSRYIDFYGLGKVSEILAGTNVHVDANILSLSIMASRYNQARTVREEFRPHKLASRL
jgi:hypothetical protein